MPETAIGTQSVLSYFICMDRRKKNSNAILSYWALAHPIHRPIFLPTAKEGNVSRSVCRGGQTPFPSVGRHPRDWHLVAATAAVGTHPSGMHSCNHPKFTHVQSTGSSGLTVVKSLIQMSWECWHGTGSSRVLAGNSSGTISAAPWHTQRKNKSLIHWTLQEEHLLLTGLQIAFNENFSVRIFGLVWLKRNFS